MLGRGLRTIGTPARIRPIARGEGNSRHLSASSEEDLTPYPAVSCEFFARPAPAVLLTPRDRAEIKHKRPDVATMSDPAASIAVPMGQLAAKGGPPCGGTRRPRRCGPGAEGAGRVPEAKRVDKYVGCRDFLHTRGPTESLARFPAALSPAEAVWPQGACGATPLQRTKPQEKPMEPVFLSEPCRSVTVPVRCMPRRRSTHRARDTESCARLLVHATRSAWRHTLCE